MNTLLTVTYTSFADFVYRNRSFKTFSLQYITIVILTLFVVMKKYSLFITFVIYSNICEII